MSDDLDETPDCFKEYDTPPNKRKKDTELINMECE